MNKYNATGRAKPREKAPTDSLTHTLTNLLTSVYSSMTSPCYGTKPPEGLQTADSITH